jgi:hypothetical protein
MLRAIEARAENSSRACSFATCYSNPFRLFSLWDWWYASQVTHRLFVGRYGSLWHRTHLPAAMSRR